RGGKDGRFRKPRAITIDEEDRVFIVDTTGRIQHFDVDGNHKNTWSTPAQKNGKPTGIGIARWYSGGSRAANIDADDAAPFRLIVADTHYYRMLVYQYDGKRDLSVDIGGTSGPLPGQFAFLTDVAQDDRGRFFIGEYGDRDRIQVFTPTGEFEAQFGSSGVEPGQFLRPQGLMIDGEELWVADAMNHRIQIFDISTKTPRLIGLWGELGRERGQMAMPYGIDRMSDGTIIVCEYQNARVQHFDRDGNSLGILASLGHEPGQLRDPWGLAVDSKDRIHVLDSYSNRVQRFPRPRWDVQPIS
ncbi:MAG: 6-bladed beta-propeller, partial [Planctomycetota bacterium]